MSARPADPGCVLEHAPQSESPQFESAQFESVQFDPLFAPQSRQRTEERPDTPCVAVCSTTFDDVCRGCGRTVAEVAHWVSMTGEQKEAVWVRILAQGYPRRNT